MNDKVYIGIDIGKKGGIVILSNGKIHALSIMPLIAGEDVDIKTILAMINYYKKETIHVVMEKFGGFFGFNKSAAISLARQSGMIEAALIGAGIAYTRISPQVWQKVVWQGTNIFLKPDGKKDTKKISLITALRLFPDQTFLASDRCKIPHDGIIDGVLLAEFGRRMSL